MQRLRTLASLALVGGVMMLAPTAPSWAVTPNQRMDRYFSVWADNAEITPGTVNQFYTHSVSYYGRTMTAEEIYRDKLGYVRQWPVRRYAVVPGSVGKTCDAGESRCRVTAILRWQKADASGRNASQGANTITLDLVRQDGLLKIARESGTPVVSASCTGRGVARRCAGFR